MCIEYERSNTNDKPYKNETYFSMLFDRRYENLTNHKEILPYLLNVQHIITWITINARCSSRINKFKLFKVYS